MILQKEISLLKNTLIKIKKFDLKNNLHIIYGICIILIAVLLRFLFIKLRPVHHDEGVNGWFVMNIWRTGFYRYDPANFHGPLWFYILQLGELILGKGIFSLRFITAIFSVMSIVVVLLFYKFTGKTALWAGLIMAVSPAMSFYARYAIHETIFIFFQVLFLYGAFHYFTGYKVKTGIILMNCGIFGSFAVKETFFIYFVIFFIALIIIICLTILNRALKLQGKFFTNKTQVNINNQVNVKKILNEIVFFITCFISGFLIVSFIYTGFLMYPEGFFKMLGFWKPWIAQGLERSGHAKNCWYYLLLLFTYELPVLFTLMICIPLFIFSTKYCRFFIILGTGLFIVYMLISYKTPWLIMNFIWPFFFAAGYLIEKLFSHLSCKNNKHYIIKSFFDFTSYLLLVFIGIMIVTSCIQTIHINYINHSNQAKSLIPVYTYLSNKKNNNKFLNKVTYPFYKKKYPEKKYYNFYYEISKDLLNDEPYFYVHTKNDLKIFYNNIFKLAEKDSKYHNEKIQFFIKSPWPLPWIFSDWQNAFFSEYSDDSEVNGIAMIIDYSDACEFEKKLKELPFKYIKINEAEYRGSYNNVNYYYRYDLFKNIVKDKRAEIFP